MAAVFLQQKLWVKDQRGDGETPSKPAEESVGNSKLEKSFYIDCSPIFVIEKDQTRS